MMSAVAGYPAWGHFPAFRYELGKSSNVLVVDFQCLVCAETTHLAPKHRSAARTALVIVRPLAVRPRTWFPLCHGSIYLVSFTDQSVATPKYHPLYPLPPPKPSSGLRGSAEWLFAELSV